MPIPVDVVEALLSASDAPLEPERIRRSPRASAGVPEARRS